MTAAPELLEELDALVEVEVPEDDVEPLLVLLVEVAVLVEDVAPPAPPASPASPELEDVVTVEPPLLVAPPVLVAPPAPEPPFPLETHTCVPLKVSQV